MKNTIPIVTSKEKNSTELKVKNPYSGHNWFSLTISPSPAFQWYENVTRPTCFRKYIMGLFHDFSSYHIDYQMHFELSTPMGDLAPNYLGPLYHVHGIIRIRNKKALFNWLCYALPKLCKNNNISIDTINDPQIWYDYCHKDEDWQELQPISNQINLWKQFMEPGYTVPLGTKADADKVCVQD